MIDHSHDSQNRDIDIKLDELMESFLKSAQDLFRKNVGYIKEFESGRYSCAYVTPSRRLRQTMAVDREILVVASTFTDQQQRTIKFVQSEIANSGGRLEPTVALVIHLDALGSAKLRNWGRDLGISILPIDGRNGFGEARDIEKQLATQLFSHDPFDVTGPVSGDSQFFGRRDEAIDLARKLQQGQIRSSLGIRKVGKTSIINRILKEIPTHFECKTVMIDCSKDDIFELTAEGLLFSLSATLKKMRVDRSAYENLHVQQTRQDLSDSRKSLEEIILSLSEVVLFVFDEVDYITPGSPTAQHWKEDFNRFWRNLRAVYQECDRRAKPFSLLISGVSTFWFTVEQIGGIENAALAFVPEEFLSPMPTGATIAMLRRLGKVAGITFSESAAKCIAEETGNMPYWARKCSSFIHRQIPLSSRPITLEQRDVELMVEKFIDNEGCPIAEVALSHLFRVHPEMKQASDKVSSGITSTIPEATRRTLRKYGVTNAKDEFSGSMIRKAFNSLAEAEINQSQNLDGKQFVAADSLGEWAEDLAALGQRRNLLERKLRGVILNFLRMDALQNKRLDHLTESVLKTMVDARRKMLFGLPLDSLFQKLMWLELVNLISVNWQVFEVIFGDKKQFEEHVNLVNDRPDAHAKEWDQADFALYRRSLQWLEDRLSKLQ